MPKQTTVAQTGNILVAEAMRQCAPDVMAAYPITPQSPIYEKLSEWDGRGEVGARMMRVESEHSAMAACISASMSGQGAKARSQAIPGMLLST